MGKLRNAEKLVELFHGRKKKAVIDFTENYQYREDLAELGKLIDIELKENDVTITFFDLDEDDDGTINHLPTPNEERKMISLCSEPSGNQYYFERGDQEIDLGDKVFSYLSPVQKKKDYIPLGEIMAISYYTDKHHLSDEGQEEGTIYRHELGENGGELPQLVYDKLNKKLMLIGGEYETMAEGIAN